MRTGTIVNTLDASSVISSFAYDYDDNGNRVEQVEQNGGAEETTGYDYNVLDRLATVTYPDNIISLDGNNTLRDLDYVYDPRNQLTDINDLLEAQQNVSYTFDGNGNQTSKTVDSTTTDFVYDARDNLRQVLTGGSSVGQFLYDDKGMRIEKLGDRGTERYTYDDLSVITQSDGSNSTIAKYDYGAARLLSLNHETEGTQFYLNDVLGSVANLTREDGGIQARYQYDAFGNYRQQVGTSHNRFGFTGHEVDTETGLIYFKARFYDPETGRFLSHDAFEGRQDKPPSLHRYLYVYQNPTFFIDPDGNEATPLFSRPLTDQTGQIQPIGTFDSGDDLFDAVGATTASVTNLVPLFVNSLLNGLSLPSRAGAHFTGQSVEEFETNVLAATMPLGPQAAGVTNIITSPLRAPRLLQKLRGKRGGSNTNISIEDPIKPSSIDEVQEFDVQMKFKNDGKFDADKFNSQAAGQGRSLEKFSAGENRDRLDKFASEVRPPLAAKTNAKLRKDNPEIGSHQAVIHEPDCCLGNPGDEVAGFGDARINSSIGSQNKVNKREIRQALDNAPANAKVKVQVIVDGEVLEK